MSQPPVPDLWSLYRRMFRSRLFEESVAALWHEGLISGEMHMGTGEEAIIAGVLDHIRDGDALALDHRATAALLLRGVNPILLIREFLGRPDGLCRGMGGHMHLFSRENLAASSGIVGASAPAAAGFALAASLLRPRSVAFSFFGEGAMNQGMVMEGLNLAAVWALPVLFVCKDNGWAITTRSGRVTAGSLPDRVCGLGVHYVPVDGRDVLAVWHATEGALRDVRAGKGPALLHATCVHLDGHFLGDALLRAAHASLPELAGTLLAMSRSALRPGGASLRERLRCLADINGMVSAARADCSPRHDPLARARLGLTDECRLSLLETEVAREVRQAVAQALEIAAERAV